MEDIKKRVGCKECGNVFTVEIKWQHCEMCYAYYIGDHECPEWIKRIISLQEKDNCLHI